MRNNSYKGLYRTLIATFFCAAFVSCGCTLAQAQRATLADGDPPLTSEMVGRYAALMEWSLDLQFDPAERKAVEKHLVDYWQAGDEKNIKAVVDTLAFEKKLGQANRPELQPRVKQAVLEALEKDSADALSSMLLATYRRNQSGGGRIEARGRDFRALVGTWRVLHGNSIVSVDQASGRIGDGNSMIAEYDIRPDGHVAYTFVLQQSNYGCTTNIKTHKTGRAVVAGSRVTFSYDAGGNTVSEDNCNARFNYAKKTSAEQETFDFQIKSEDGKPQFCFANAKLKDCAIKIK